MLRALDEYEIEGLKTLIPFHKALLATEQWANGETCRDLLEDKQWLKTLAFPAPVAEPGGDDGASPGSVEHTYTVEISGKRFDVRVLGPAFADNSAAAVNGAAPAAAPKPARAARRARDQSNAGGPDTLASPLQGNMWKVLVKEGDAVQEGQLLCIIEAMKMENEITAHKAGTISELPIAEGAAIQAGAPIATITSAAE